MLTPLRIAACSALFAMGCSGSTGGSSSATGTAASSTGSTGHTATSASGGASSGHTASSAAATAASTSSSTGHTSATAATSSSGPASSSTGHTSSSTGHTSSSTGTTSATSTASTSTSTGATSTATATSSTGGSSGASGLGPSIDALVGLNGFITDPLDQLAQFGTVREYHDWTWNDGNGASGYQGYPNNQLQFDLWNGYWDFDTYYATLADAGATVFPCIEGGVQYENNALPPVASGADPTLPASYAAHASFMFQFAARYGSVVVPDGELLLDPSQVRVSGMNVLHYFEDGNEPDNNWSSGNGTPVFTPEVYAAMASADYDGDQGRLGTTFGVKGADPSAKMVMAGLAMAGSSDPVTNATAYLEGIRQWSVANRGGSFPADVLNIHQYCFGPSGANPGPGLSPEDCNLSTLLSQMVAYKQQNLPHLELWLTEFGYDTNPSSILRAPAIGSTASDVVQGQWLTRSILAIAESGIDRATLFVSADGCTAANCSNASVQFTTSGIWTDSPSGFTPKASYYLVSSFRKALAGLSFKGVVSGPGASVRVDAFADGTGHGAYVVWSPTKTEAIVAGYSLAVPGATQVSAIQLSSTAVTGTSQTLTVDSGSVTLDVGETPVVVLVDHLQ